MMIECNANTLADSAQCLSGCLGRDQLLAIEVYLLAVMANQSTDPKDLISQAGQIYCCVPAGMYPAIQAYLLCQIANGGGGGITTCLIRLPGAGPPTDPPPCPLSIAASQSPNSGVWLGDSTTGLWEELIVPGP